MNEIKKEMNITDMTTMELESICYRQLVLLKQTENNIQIIQQELQKRLEQEQIIKKEV